ncbi:MAG TPA: hypothetical protein VGI43_19235 [Mucilaginibacter sp.]|jgi:hypothetical protein
MGKKDIKTSGDTQNLFPKLRAYSVDEILAAGGTTAFANKMGKTAQSLIDHLKNRSKDAFLTDEDVADALKMLNESK